MSEAKTLARAGASQNRGGRIRTAVLTDPNYRRNPSAHALVAGLNCARLLAGWIVEVRLDRRQRATQALGDLGDRQTLELAVVPGNATARRRSVTRAATAVKPFGAMASDRTAAGCVFSAEAQRPFGCRMDERMAYRAARSLAVNTGRRQRPASVRGGWQAPQRVIGAPARAIAQSWSSRRSPEHTFTQSPVHVLPRAGSPVIV